jgi:hypothetical protein
MGKVIKIFNMANAYSGGGTYFPEGRYKWEKVRFVMFNFNKEGGDEACCFQVTCQPLNSKGKAEGEKIIQHWPLENAGKGQYKPGKGGKTVEAIGEYETIWRKSDFYYLMESLQKEGYDMDKYEEDGDVSVLEGLVADMALWTKPGSETTDEEGKTKKYQVAVVTGLADAPKESGKKDAKKSTKKEEEEEEEEDTDTDTDSEEEEEEGGDDDAESLLDKYLEKKVLVEDNEGGVARMEARMGIAKFIKDDPDKAKAVIKLFNDDKVLAKRLKKAGWEVKELKVKGKMVESIVKEED